MKKALLFGICTIIILLFVIPLALAGTQSGLYDPTYSKISEDKWFVNTPATWITTTHSQIYNLYKVDDDNISTTADTSSGVTLEGYYYVNYSTYDISSSYNLTAEFYYYFSSGFAGNYDVACLKTGSYVNIFTEDPDGFANGSVQIHNESIPCDIINNNITLRYEYYFSAGVPANLGILYDTWLLLNGSPITYQIDFRNETDNNLLSGLNVSYEFISDSYTIEGWTTSGYANVSLESDDYTIRYSSPNYGERFYFVSVTSPTQNDYLTLYLGNSSTLVTATVLDQVGVPVENVTISYYRYYPINGSYRLVGQAKTNFEGESILELTLSVEFYYFTFLYNNVIVLETEPAYVEEDSITFTIFLGGGQDLQKLIGFSNIICNLTNNGSDDVVILDWGMNEEDSSVITGCVFAYQPTISGLILLTETCTDSPFALTVSHNDQNYYAVGKIYQSGYNKNCPTRQDFIKTPNASSIFGILAAFGIALLITALVLIFSESGLGVLIGASIGVVISFIIGISAFTWQQSLGLILFVVIIGLVGRMYRG